MARFMGTTDGHFGGRCSASSRPDTADPTINQLIPASGRARHARPRLLLSDQFKPQREAYRAYIERTFQTIGTPNPAAAADHIMAFETEVAKLSWAIADRREVDKTNNPMSSAKLAAYAPGFDWAAFFAGAKIRPQKRQSSARTRRSKPRRAVRGDAARDAQGVGGIPHRRPGLALPQQGDGRQPVRVHQDPFRRVTSSARAGSARSTWSTARWVNSSGRTYVEPLLPAFIQGQDGRAGRQSKAAMTDRIQANSWMSEATKAAALEKLARMDVMVGYPDKFRDYGALADRAGRPLRQCRALAGFQRRLAARAISTSRWTTRSGA